PVHVEDQAHDHGAEDPGRDGALLQKAQDSSDGPGAEHNAADGAAHGNKAAGADAEHQREGQRGRDRSNAHQLKVQQRKTHHRNDDYEDDTIVRPVQQIATTDTSDTTDDEDDGHDHGRPGRGESDVLL